jgi:uncharacterized protein YggE
MTVIAVTAALPALLTPTAAAQERTIVVKGSAEQQVVNDTASLRFTVSKDRRTRAAALGAMAAHLRNVIATARSFPGVGPGDVTTSSVSVRRLPRPKPYYRATQAVTVVLHDASRAGELITAAIAAGATSTHGPEFFPGDPNAAFMAALVAAFDQAKAKATALAARAGSALGPVISIEEGAEVVPPPAPTTAAPRKRGGEPSPPDKPGTSTVMATVRVVFALQ